MRLPAIIASGGFLDTAAKRNVFIVHLNIVVYALAFWLTNPLLPFLLKEQGASSLSLGAMQSLFNVVQLAGGLVVGFLQDHYSGSAALSVTQLGSALVYVSLFGASNLTMLYVSRLPTVLQQSMQVAQAYVSKSSLDDATRTVSMSRLSLSYAIGMIIGSSASGYIADGFGMRVNAALATALSVGCILLNYFYLAPIDVQAAEKKKTDGDAKEEEDKGFSSYASLAVQLRKVIIFLMCLFAVRSIFEPVNNLTLIDKYQLTKTDMGKLTSVMAAVGAATNILVLPFIVKVLKVSEAVLTRSMLLVASGAYVCMATMPFGDTATIYVGLLGLQAVASSILYITCTTYAVGAVDKSKHGRVVAMSHALRSAVGIVCPLVGTWILNEYGPSAVAYLNAGALLIGVVIM